MYKLIIFDLDGTLIDSDDMVIETYVTLFKKYKPTEKIDRERFRNFSGPTSESTLKREFSEYDFDYIFQEYLKIVEVNRQKHVHLFPNELEFLKSLKEKGYILTIATSKTHQATLQVFEKYGLGNYIDYFVSSDDVINPKPHPESINKIIDKYHINKEEVLYVGDSEYDVLTSINSNIDVALVTFCQRNIIHKENVKKFCNNYQELYNFIEEN